MPARSALVYGDVNLNLIDGSAIWVQSMVLARSRAGGEVPLVLKAPVHTDRLLPPLNGLPGVTIRRPAEEELLAGIGPNGMTPKQASQALSKVDAELAAAQGAKHDIVVLRGRRLVDQVVTDGDFDGRLWTYLTDIPQSIPEMTPEAVSWLTGVAGASAYVLCQTEELRCFLEGSVPAACGKCVLFPPVVPPPPEVTGEPAEPTGVLRLVYTGKFAPRWNTYEMTELPGLLAQRGVRAELHMVGDKIHNDPDDPGYHDRMRAALGTEPAPGEGAEPPAVIPANGVVWRGGHSREDAMRIAASADIGLGWRHPALDASLELSTKVLEFGLLGLPVILNRTPMHEALLGADYPMFAAGLDDVVAIAESAAADPAILKLAASRTSAAAAEFTLGKASDRVRRYLDDALPRIEAGPGTTTLKVAVAGHDLKF